MSNRTKIYTVSQINSLIKEILENNLPARLIITGEITNWSIARSGHAYFGLKDENALLPCVCWKSSLSRIKFEPENGLAVIAKGHIEVYSPHGKYQFYAESMQPAGIGALHLAFEQMVKRLQAEGLFDEKHKKPLPLYPQRIGILTSESGAAVHDIKDSIQNRWPPAELFLYPVPVQGEGAAEEIAAAIRDVNKRNKKLKLDILIVGRGGGSLEDLWAFNEEVLARAIFDSKIPVISAVGHEVDTTIADFVADARASTPTKAGVVAVPDMQDVLEGLDNFKKRLGSQLKFMVHNSQQQSDELCFRLQSSVKHLLADTRNTLYAIAEQIRTIEPHRLLASKTVILNNLLNQANAAMKEIINKRRLRLTAQTNRLAGLNPKSILQRGYSITTNKKTGLLVRHIKDVKIGDMLNTELTDENFIESRVTKK
ncbi:MAG: exodeoxyribonuclease VII large subunit [Planctomycetes bacterium]|nr:exodeoxyribonuclease VII large subunit [Planctomycetota bacterium]